MRFKILIPGALALAGIACWEGRPKDLISASGTIEAIEINVASKVAGQVVELAAEEGRRVEPGDILAIVDHAALDIQLRQATAGVRLAEAQLALLVKGARSEDIRQAEETLKQAEASLKLAADDARRMRDLAGSGSVTPKSREDAETRLAVATAQKNAADEALKKVRRLARPEEIRAAEARLAQAQAAADLLAKTIADCTIAAPSAGVVTQRAVERGELVSPGATLVTLVDLDIVSVMIYVPEKVLGRIKLGDRAEVRIDAFPDKTFAGEVTYISPEAEFTPKNVQTKEDRVKLVFGVKIEIENREGWLKPGLPADALIRVAPVV
ncbi:MAG: secretion protein HlyD family protein [Candidatus Aminicenantes bacterium]|nr:secretion protein HlyD family protein [Candidatus Aminicenantes bacterium]